MPDPNVGDRRAPMPGMNPGERRSVAVVVLTWNALDYTRRCLDALRMITDHPSWRVIVVDNGSTDGTVEYLHSQDWLTVIENGENLGFTRGNNIGIRASRADEDILLLNNDIIATEPGWLRTLQDLAYADERNGIVGTRLIDPQGRINHIGSYIAPLSLLGEQMGGLEFDINQATRNREIECTIFAVAYIRRDCMNAIGLLDEQYFAYLEDTDYCFRAKTAGYRVMYGGETTLLHHHNTSTRVNKVDIWSYIEPSKKVFARKWAKWLEQDRYETSAIFNTMLHRPLGLSAHGRKIMLSLHFAGVRIAYRNAYDEPEEPTGHPLLEDLRQRRLPKRTPSIAYCMAHYFQNQPGTPRIGWTMLEVTGLPDDWVAGCNAMDEVWVPAAFNVETFRNSGVRVPIRVMPLGFDPDYRHPGIRDFRPTDKFTFLAAFEWGERKAPEILFRAFASEFKANEDVVLLASVNNHDPTIDVAAEMKKLELPDSAPIVVMLNSDFADYQLGSLYRCADAFVSATRGEGWGMHQLEAAACGVPVITTGWGGTTDFISESTGYPIQYRMVPAVARCPYYEGFDWAEPDIDHLRHLMRHVYEHPDEARSKGAAAAADVLSRFTWEHTAARVKQRLLELR